MRAFVTQFFSFLKEIRDKEGKTYGSCIKGIPQGSPLSPVLMNIFLHQLDVKMQDFMSKEARIKYVRYADDIAFDIKEGANSEMVSQGFKQFFNEALTELKLEATSLELVRGISKPCSTLVLGVLISIRPDRQLELRAAINRLKIKKWCQSIDNDIRKIQGKRVKHFERALLPRVFQYLAPYSCCCNANEVLAFIQNLYIQKYKLYLQLHKKIKPKGKGETENLLNLRSINTRLKHFQL